MNIRSVDIAICTWNRWRLLQQTLESIFKLRVPPAVSLTLIVVDNGSTDDTQQVLNRFLDSGFGQRHRLVVVNELRQGHTFARNRAIAESRSDLILWTDDDVRVNADWVEKYVAAANHRPEFSFWGSQIRPVFTNGRPKWVSENWKILSGCFASRDLGDQPVLLTEDRLPYGANFAVRGPVQREHPFDQGLGRRAAVVVGEDEIDLMQRLLRHGMQGEWVPGATVEHLIPADRATTEYVYHYFIGQGKKLVLNQQPWHWDAAKMEIEAKAEFRRFWWKRFVCRSAVWCSHLVRAGLAMGQWRAMQSTSSAN